VHLFVFKDTFILRFYSILRLELLHLFCKDDPETSGGILVVERKDKAEARPSFYVGVTQEGIEVVLRECRKIFF
jgi:hypothetical protein